MKKIKLLFFFICLFPTIGFSQLEGMNYTPEQRASVQTAWMKQNLNLTDNQSDELTALNLEYAYKMEEVKSIDGKMKKLKRARAISNEKDEKLKAILNDNQFDVYLDKRKELLDAYQEKLNEMKEEQE